MIQSYNKKIIIIVITVIIVIIMITLRNSPAKKAPSPSPSAQAQQNNSAQIISTKPDPLENTFILASQVIEITFNKPLQNSGEFKIRVEPKIEYRIKLSQDRKTAKIIPVKPYELGISYTLTIGSDTKFDGIGDWGENQDFHFRTITYKGV